MPEGWNLAPFGGPFEGSDLLVLMIDRLLDLDAEGEPAEIAQYSSMVLASLATAGDESRVYVTRIYAPDESLNAYSNTLAATLGAEHMLKSGGTGNAAWSVEMPDGGGGLRFEMTFEGGTRGRVVGETFPYSAAKPDFHRIYRYTQLTELLMSKPAGVDHVVEFVFESSIGELAPMFDGSEELVAVMRLPIYMRETWLP